MREQPHRPRWLDACWPAARLEVSTSAFSRALVAQTTGRLYVVDMASARRTTLMESGVAAARFLPPDRLVYTDERGALLTVPLPPVTSTV